MTDWTGKTVAILGLGRSALSAANYLGKRKAKVILSDGGVVTEDKAHKAEELRKLGFLVELGEHSNQTLRQADLILTSPGIAPNSPVISTAVGLGKEVICDIELAFRETRTPFIGITGTNGKSTTCALVSHILQGAGYRAPVCGNIGVPILDMVDDFNDFLVVEISSYQLYYTAKLSVDIGIWLNLTPDHLDWHGNLEAYTAAKQLMFERMKYNQYAILNQDDPVVSKAKAPAQIFPFSLNSSLPNAVNGAFLEDNYLAYRLNGTTEILCYRNKLQIFGQHNLENALAATAACAVADVPAEKIRQGLISFGGLEHRLEYVTTIDGTAFYNDSKGTNPDSTIKALQAFGSANNEKVVLIAGGKDKGTPLTDLAKAIKKQASNVVLIGEAKERIQRALEELDYTNTYLASSLEEAVEIAFTLRQGPVLLSPACASFDMFKDFEERGRVFKNLVTRVEKLAPSK